MQLELYEGRIDRANKATDAEEREKLEEAARQTLKDIEAHCRRYKLDLAEALAATGLQ